MHISPIKFSLAIVAFFLLFAFTSASPIADLADRNITVVTRQEAGGVYYGDSCSGGEIGLWETMFSVSAKVLGDGSYWSTLFLFTNSCDNLIGYVPGVNIENTWYSFDSQLPLTLNVIAHNGIPQFNYGGKHYEAPYKTWTDNNPGEFQTINTQYLFLYWD